jgi:hypothetical protein
VGYRGALLRPAEVDQSFAAAWDELPPSRGVQADFYDSHAWFSSWLSGFPDRENSTRVVAVLEGDRPVAVLPIVGRRRRWSVAGADIRTRARPVIGTEQPDDEVLGSLVETVASAGVRELSLHRLPARDPATDALLRAMRAAGYRVDTHERSSDRLASVEGGWGGHSRRFKSFAQYTKRFTNKITPLWPLTMDEYGTSPERPVSAGFAIYRNVQARSWKGELPPAIATQRAALLGAAEGRGWARLYVLRIAGLPVAAHVWFRLGGVATWLSTAYEQDLAVLSPGTIVQWWSQERVFAGEPPLLLDYLPGANPQKDRLAPETPPLLVTDAVRRTVVSGVTLPLRTESRRIKAGVTARLRARAGRRREAGVEAPPPDRRMRIAPAVGGEMPARPLEVDAAVTRYLATALGAPSTQAVSETWAEGDTWWQVGSAPNALVRVSRDGVVRDLIKVENGARIGAVMAAVAGALGKQLTVLLDERDRPLRVRRAPLPWPDSWRDRELLSEPIPVGI